MADASRRTADDSNMLALAVSQLAALSGPACTRPALRAPVVSRAARRVVCAEAEAESTTNADDEGRDRGVRGARIIGFAGGAVAGRCVKLKLLPLPLLHTAAHSCTQRHTAAHSCSPAPATAARSATWEALLENNVVESVPISQARPPAHRTPPHRPETQHSHHRLPARHSAIYPKQSSRVAQASR